MKVGKKVWYAKRKEILNAEIAEYEEPIEITTAFMYFTVMKGVSRGYFFTIQPYGEALENIWTAIAYDNVFEYEVKEGDLFWIDGEEPIAELEEKYGNGATATAVVKNVAQVNFTTGIILERNQNQVRQ